MEVLLISNGTYRRLYSVNRLETNENENSGVSTTKNERRKEPWYNIYNRLSENLRDTWDDKGAPSSTVSVRKKHI